MGTRRKISVLGLSVMSLMSVQMAIADMPHTSPSNQQCYKKHPATDLLNAKESAKHSAAFRKAAEEAWRATHNGVAPFEAGFSIEKDGHPGKVQLSIFTTVEAATHLTIVSRPSAMGTLHVHNKFGKSTPSPGASSPPNSWAKWSM